MKLARFAMIVVLGGLSACGGGNRTCDEGAYQQAVRTPRVEAPDGLDDLQQTREMPLPAASPREPLPADAPCLDRPPVIIGTS